MNHKIHFIRNNSAKCTCCSTDKERSTPFCWKKKNPFSVYFQRSVYSMPNCVFPVENCVSRTRSKKRESRPCDVTVICIQESAFRAALCTAYLFCDFYSSKRSRDSGRFVDGLWPFLSGVACETRRVTAALGLRSHHIGSLCGCLLRIDCRMIYLNFCEKVLRLIGLPIMCWVTVLLVFFFLISISVENVKIYSMSFEK